MVLVVLLGFVIAREVFAGRITEVFLVVPFAKLTVNDQGTSGWVHRGVRGPWAYVTVNAPRRRESYCVNLRPTEKLNNNAQSCVS